MKQEERALRVALIGLGYWGRRIYRVLINNSSFEICALCDFVQSRLEEFNSYNDKITLLKNYKAIDFNNLDAVIIATSASHHYEIVSYFLKNNVNVFCEKPGFCSSEEAVKLKTILHNSSAKFMIGYTFLYNDVINHVKNDIDQKNTGQVYYADFIRAGLGPIRDDVNVLYDLASHDISIANYFFGQPLSVKASAKAFNKKNHYDIANIVINFNHSISATIKVSWIEPFKQRIIKIIGSSMMIEIDDTSAFEKVKLYRKGITYQKYDGEYASFQTSITDGEIIIPKIDYNEPLKNEIQHFIDCIRLNIKPKTGIEEALKVIEVIEACQKSITFNNYIDIVSSEE